MQMAPWAMGDPPTRPADFESDPSAHLVERSRIPYDFSDDGVPLGDGRRMAYAVTVVGTVHPEDGTDSDDAWESVRD